MSGTQEAKAQMEYAPGRKRGHDYAATNRRDHDRSRMGFMTKHDTS